MNRIARLTARQPPASVEVEILDGIGDSGEPMHDAVLHSDAWAVLLEGLTSAAIGGRDAWVVDRWRTDRRVPVLKQFGLTPREVSVPGRSGRAWLWHGLPDQKLIGLICRSPWFWSGDIVIVLGDVDAKQLVAASAIIGPWTEDRGYEAVSFAELEERWNWFNPSVGATEGRTRIEALLKAWPAIQESLTWHPVLIR